MNRVKAFSRKRNQVQLPSSRRIGVNAHPFDVKALGWVQFSWDLTTISSTEVALPDHYQIAPASAADAKELRKVFSSCFMLDPVWSPAIGDVMHNIQSLVDNAFDSGTNVCLALRHGARIIGAALMSLNSATENHLAPGPSVLIEYRNRGFGTLLLGRALQLLRDNGLAEARGIVRDIAPAAKFLYPKFSGTPKPVANWAAISA
jgi:GNAT superfamily N-acetyltransferase